MARDGAADHTVVPGVSGSPAGRVLAAAGAVTAGLGLVVLAGWVFGLERITAVRQGLDPMAFNAALTFGVLGVSLLALAIGSRRLALAGAGLVMLYGLLTLLQYAWAGSLSFDTIFFPPEPGSSVGGRASPNAGLCFLLSGQAVVMLAAGKGITSRLGAALLGAGTLVIALVDLLAYPLAGAGPIGALPVPQMALPTTLGMALVGSALLHAGWQLPRGVGEAHYARAGVAVGVGVAVLSVLLVQLLRSRERSQVRGMVQLAAEGVAHRLAGNLQGHAATVQSLGRLWRVLPRSGWDVAATAVIDTTGVRRGLGWLAAGAPPRRLALAPDERDLPREPWWPDSALFAAADQSAGPVPAARWSDRRIWFGLLTRTGGPGVPRGYLWSVADLHRALDQELATVSAPFTIVVRDDDRVLLRRGSGAGTSLERLWGSKAGVPMGPLRWQVTVWPTAAALVRARSVLPIMTLTAGMLVGLLLGLALALARQARLRALEIETANARLTSEISEREAAVAALRQREEELRQAQKLEAVGRLAGGIAHDYNNILTVIRGNARSLLLQEGVADLTRDALEHIDRAAARGSLLTARLLAFSQQQLLQPESLSLGDLVVALGDELAQLLGPHIRLVLERQPGLDLVRVDRRWLSQVVLDLGFNGREAMPLGGVLWVRTRMADDELRAGYGVSQVTGPAMVLEIEDSGRGMDEATRGRLFEPFFSTKRFGQGSGLALASAYGIVRQSGGEIAVQSVPDRGTRVGIFLPLAEGRPAAAAEANLAGATVLVAEDEPGVLRFVRRTLEVAGCRVIAGASAEEVLAAIEGSESAPDLLVSDIVMPGLSGVELADRLRTRYPGLAVLFSSAYTSDALKEQGIASLGAYLLQKPFTGPELLEQVARTLAQRSAGSPAR